METLRPAPAHLAATATISQELLAIPALKLAASTVLLQLPVFSVKLDTSFLALVVCAAKTPSQPAASASTQLFVHNAILPSTSTLLCSALPAH